MKICIDARMYGLKHAGIGRYVKNIIYQIKRQSCSSRTDYKISLLVRKGEIETIQRDLNGTNNIELIIAEARHYSFKEQILIPLILYKHKFDLVHFPHFNVPVLYFRKFVVTIHDLLWHEMRGQEVTTLSGIKYYIKYIGYRLVFAYAVKRAAKILTPSNWVKNNLEKTYKIVPNKVIVTYEGIDQAYLTDKTQNTDTNNKTNNHYIVYTGSAYPHKNINLLVRVIKNMNQAKLTKLRLYIVSSRNVFLDKLQQYINSEHAENCVRLLGFITDEKLAVLYAHARAFVFPSLSEGFGLPGLEAAACGCPVIAANNSALPEIYGDSALYFNPKDEKSLQEQIEKVINNPVTRNELIKKGKILINKYNWNKTAKETIRIYESCIGL